MACNPSAFLAAAMLFILFLQLADYPTGIFQVALVCVSKPFLPQMKLFNWQHGVVFSRLYISFLVIDLHNEHQMPSGMQTNKQQHAKETSVLCWVMSV